MSRIGRRPIDIIEGTTASFADGSLEVKGVKGTLSYTMEEGIDLSIVDAKVFVSTKQRDQKHTALFGLTRAVINNMILGVSKGFEKKLELIGVGFRATVLEDELTLMLGFSHPVKIKAPDGITFSVLEGKSQGTIVSISGIDKHLVGQVAATIRDKKPPEPYKGKGIRYLNERIRKKAGKAAKTVGASK